MEILENQIIVKLNEEERDALVSTCGLLSSLRFEMPCHKCPFETRCNERHKENCLLETLHQDLTYINMTCD